MPILSFDPNGGSFGSDPYEFVSWGGSFIDSAPVIVVSSGDIPSLQGISSYVVRPTYRLVGWTTSSDGTGQVFGVNFNPPSITVTADITLYAKWVRVFTITYDGNGGEGTGPNNYEEYLANQEALIVPPQNSGFTRLGYHVISWNTNSDGSGTTYIYQTGHNTIIMTQDVTLYAIWLYVGYITYDGNGVSSGISTLDDTSSGINCEYVRVNYDVHDTRGIPFVKDGYTVVTWNTHSDGTGDSYSAYYDAHNRAVIKTITSITLYAQWQPSANLIYKVNNSNVQYYNGDIIDEGYVNRKVEIRSTDIFNYSVTGFSISYWNTQSDGNGITYHRGSLITLSGDTTLYAIWVPKKYITFNTNGVSEATMPNPIEVRADSHTVGSVVLAFPGPTISSLSIYRFSYWCTSPDGLGVEYLPSTNYSIEVNNTLFYAIWEIKTLISFSANFPQYGNNSGTTPASIELVFNNGSATATIPVCNLANTLYSLRYWCENPEGNGILYSLQETIEVSRGISLYAIWEYTPLLITYANGATSGYPPNATRSIKSYYVPTTGFYSLKDLTFLPIFPPSYETNPLKKTGYSFGDGANAWIRDKIPSTEVPDEYDYTATANWLKSYIFNYDGNGSTGGTPPESIEAARKNITVSSKGTLVREGYRFLNWSTNQDGSGEKYSPGDRFQFNNRENSGLPYYPRDITLYAQWEVTYVIIYNPQGGTGDYPQPSIFYKDTIKTVTIPQTNTTKEGYRFLNWNTSQDGTGTSYVPGDSFSVTNTNVILYAQWKILLFICYDPQLPGLNPIYVSNLLEGSTVTIAQNTFTKPFSTFINWNTTLDGLGITYTPGESYVVTTQLILYPMWNYSPEFYYDLQYPGGISTKNHYPTGTVIKLPIEPKRLGYTFYRWVSVNPEYPEFFNGGDNLTILTTDIVLYAQWIRHYSITYSFDGTIDREVIVEIPTTNPTKVYDATGVIKDDLIFSHWTTMPDGSGSVFPINSMVSYTDDIILYAQWKTIDSYSTNSIYTIYTK